MLQKVAKNFSNPISGIKKLTIKLFQNQLNLSEEILQKVAKKFSNPISGIRKLAVEVFQDRPTLSEEILQKVAERFSDPDSDVRRAAIEVLQSQQTWLEEILQSDQVMKDLYVHWLEYSFREQLSVYIEDNSFFLNTSNGIKELRLNNEQRDRLRTKIREISYSRFF